MYRIKIWCEYSTHVNGWLRGYNNSLGYDVAINFESPEEAKQKGYDWRSEKDDWHHFIVVKLDGLWVPAGKRGEYDA